MKKSEIKKHNEEAKKKLDNISAKLSDPFECDYYDEDTEKILQVLRKEQIDVWFNITQSNMKILLDLKKKGLLKDEKTHSRQFNENLKAIGWGNAKELEDIGEDTLEHTSPIYMLKEMYDIDSMILKRAKATNKRIIKEFDRYFEKRDNDSNKDISVLDMDSDIFKLYEASIEDNEQKEQALRDINEVGVLHNAYEELKSDLRLCGGRFGSFQREVYFEQFVKEFIERAIALGYTAGINANTTQTLRKSGKSNRNNTNLGQK